MKSRRTFPKELVKEYGEQIQYDCKRTNNSIEDCAWSSVYVAEAVGQITEREMKRFHAAIVKYAEKCKPTLEELRITKAKVAEQFSNMKHVNGIGIGDGCIHLYLEKPSKVKFPEKIDGIPLKITVIGKIRAL